MSSRIFYNKNIYNINKDIFDVLRLALKFHYLGILAVNQDDKEESKEPDYAERSRETNNITMTTNEAS
jgi:hypothetical protein